MIMCADSGVMQEACSDNGVMQVACFQGTVTQALSEFFLEMAGWGKLISSRKSLVAVFSNCHH